MPNGKPGDHPYTDIVVHGHDVYSSRVAGLVREIALLADEKKRQKLSDLLLYEYNEFENPDVEKLERILNEQLASLKEIVRNRGFDNRR